MKFIHKDNQFTLMDDNQELGYLTYKMQDGIMHLDGTFVHPEFEGNGYAAMLVDEVARYARDNQLKAIPVCSYIVAKFDHGGYEDIDNR